MKSPRQQAKLEYCGLAPMVDALVASEDVGVSKPDPELFRIALYADVYTPDATGQRFLIARPAPATETVPLELLLNPLR